MLFDCSLAGYDDCWLRVAISYIAMFVGCYVSYAAFIVGLCLFWLLLFEFSCFYDWCM